MYVRSTLSRWLLIAGAVALTTAPVMAQSEGGSAPPSPPSSGGGSSTPPSGPAPGQPGTQQPGTQQPGSQQPGTVWAPRPRQSDEQEMAPQFQRPLIIRGYLLLDDGSPAPAGVVIERVCDGIPRPETYTDPNGGFSFEVGGQLSGLVPDASYARGRIGFGATSSADPMTGGAISPEASLFGCELRASLPGFRSEAVPLSGRGVFDSDVGAMVLHRIAEVEGFTFSVTTALAPKKAQEAYRNGVRRARNGNWEKAEIELRKAVEQYADYAVAWQALGEVLEAQQRPAEAREAYERAVEADGGYLSPYLLIAVLAARENDWQEMEAATKQVIRLNPFDFPQAYYFQAVARANLNDLAGAERSAREAIARDADEQYPDVERLLGLVLAERGKLAEASEHLSNYLEHNPDGDDIETIRSRLAELDSQIAAHP